MTYEEGLRLSLFSPFSTWELMHVEEQAVSVFCLTTDLTVIRKIV